jgi:hypothetical protein
MLHPRQRDKISGEHNTTYLIGDSHQSFLSVALLLIYLLPLSELGFERPRFLTKGAFENRSIQEKQVLSRRIVYLSFHAHGSCVPLFPIETVRKYDVNLPPKKQKMGELISN